MPRSSFPHLLLLTTSIFHGDDKPEVQRQRTQGRPSDSKHCLQNVEARYSEPDVFSLPEVRLQLSGGVVDHGTETVYAGAGQSTPNALLHYIKHIIHHAGGELALLIAVHGNSLQRKLSQCLGLSQRRRPSSAERPNCSSAPFTLSGTVPCVAGTTQTSLQ